MNDKRYTFIISFLEYLYFLFQILYELYVEGFKENIPIKVNIN